MGSCSRLSLFLILGALTVSIPAFADGSHERTQFGHDIVVSSTDKATEVTCFGCSIRIRGQVASDVTAFGGSVVIEENGQVGGDTTVFGGDLRLDNGAEVRDVTVFGGKVHRDPGATVTGDVTTFAGGAALWLFLIFGVPFLILGGLIALVIWLVRRYSSNSMPMPARV